MKTIKGTCPYCSTKIELGVLDDKRTYSETPCCFMIVNVENEQVTKCTDYPKSTKTSKETLDYLIQEIEKIKNEKTDFIALV